MAGQLQDQQSNPRVQRPLVGVAPIGGPLLGLFVSTGLHMVAHVDLKKLV